MSVSLRAPPYRLRIERRSARETSLPELPIRSGSFQVQPDQRSHLAMLETAHDLPRTCLGAGPPHSDRRLSPLNTCPNRRGNLRLARISRKVEQEGLEAFRGTVPMQRRDEIFRIRLAER